VPVDADDLPARLGGFTVERRAHEGGTAHVFLAHDDEGGAVAVKLPRRAAWSELAARARFQREAELLARLRHPGLPAWRGGGELADGRPWLAMTWLPGATLAEALGEPWPVERARAVFAALAEVLACLHDAGLVHRDVSARNVLVDGARVGLVDLGLAVPAGTSADAAGTALTMAPEQILAAPVSPATDVHALGALLFHAVTGRPPFLADSVAALHGLRLTATAPRAGELVPAAAEVDGLLAACLAREPAQRPADARAFVARLAGGRREGVLVVEVDDVEAAAAALATAGLPLLAAADGLLLVAGTREDEARTRAALAGRATRVRWRE
jgi:serine/threonine-protein kinase